MGSVRPAACRTRSRSSPGLRWGGLASRPGDQFLHSDRPRPAVRVRRLAVLDRHDRVVEALGERTDLAAVDHHPLALVGQLAHRRDDRGGAAAPPPPPRAPPLGHGPRPWPSPASSIDAWRALTGNPHLRKSARVESRVTTGKMVPVSGGGVISSPTFPSMFTVPTPPT